MMSLTIDNVQHDAVDWSELLYEELVAGHPAIKWRLAVVYASYSLKTGEAMKEGIVRESTEPAVDERFDGESCGNDEWIL